MAYTFDPNNLAYRMIRYFKESYLDVDIGKRERLHICNEGSSRSSKTWDFYHFLFWLCDLKEVREKPLQIIVVRKTLKNCREIAYDADFVPCMKLIGHYSLEHERNAGQSPRYNLFGSIIKFKGLDDGEELGRSDVIFFNEALDNDVEKVVNDMLRRCEMLFVADWNPKLTFHFLFNWEGRDNVMFTKTTFWDNKHLSSSVKNGILATCPYDFKDFDVETRTWLKPEEEREVNLVNKTNNTIDKWAWLVYGEGVRCPEDGVIFKDIEWIKEFPDNLEEVKFGLDFGYTCFDGNTLITTNKGYKKIKNIKKGDFVLTENGFHKVLSLNNNGVKHIVEKYIEFDFGYINIISTFDHLFKTNQGWKQLKDLQKGELLYLNVNTKEKYTEVTNLGKRKGISLMFQKIKNFIEKYGKMLMEKYKKAKRYIILMGIHIIMNCQILFKSLTLNIQKYIIVYLELYQNLHLQNKIGKKEELKRFLNYKAKKNNVSHVIKHLLLQIHIKYHAVLNVIINFNILILDLMKHIFAKFAAHLLKEINILNRKLALQYVHINCLEVKEINTIREYEDIVYDLTIDGYNSYFANDILVHNCDPSVLVKVGRSGFDLYLEYLTYQSCPSPDHLYDLVDPILTKEYEKRKLEAGKLDFEHVIVHCDSSDKYKDVEFVNSLNETKYVKGKDFDFIKTRKTGIVVGISAIKKFNLHIVDNGSEITKKSRIEFENYTTKIISGIQTNIPIDAFNHGIDAFRYVVVDNWIYLVR